jgi:hypothetical protein
MSWITPELLDALRMVESSGNNKAVSSAGAVGEYQFMPENVHDMGYGVPSFDPKNPEQARKAAAQYLSGMQEHHGWTPEQTLQAYNWGPGNMKKYLAGTQKMPTETSDYVGKFGKFGWNPKQTVAAVDPVAPELEIPKAIAASTVNTFIQDVFGSDKVEAPKQKIATVIPQKTEGTVNRFISEVPIRPSEYIEQSFTPSQESIAAVKAPDKTTNERHKDFFTSFWDEFTKDTQI